MKHECPSCGYVYEKDIDTCPVCGSNLKHSDDNNTVIETKPVINKNDYTASLIGIIMGGVAITFEIFKLFSFLGDVLTSIRFMLLLLLGVVSSLVSLILGIVGMTKKHNTLKIPGLIVGIAAAHLLIDYLNATLGLVQTFMGF